MGEMQRRPGSGVPDDGHQRHGEQDASLRLLERAGWLLVAAGAVGVAAGLALGVYLFFVPRPFDPESSLWFRIQSGSQALLPVLLGALLVGLGTGTRALAAWLRSMAASGDGPGPRSARGRRATANDEIDDSAFRPPPPGDPRHRRLTAVIRPARVIHGRRESSAVDAFGGRGGEG